MITLKTKYALQTLLYLAKLPANQGCSIPVMATACAVPKKYLEQLLSSLRKEGIVASKRGSQGGYYLAQSPDTLCVYTVAMCLERSVSFAHDYTGSKVLTGFWHQVDDALKAAMHVSVATLLEEERKDNHVLQFNI